MNSYVNMDKQLQKQLSVIKKVLMNSLSSNQVPFPVNKSICSSWTNELPHGGDTVLYTSFMYQLASLFKTYEKHLGTFASIGGSTKIASLGKFFLKPKKEELEHSYSILRNISSLLQKAGIVHGYLYDDEPYSGGLLLELGMLDEFREYGKTVLEIFDKNRVKRIITVDPHTTNAMQRLKEIYHSDLEVINYLTAVNKAKGEGEYVFHDPCLYTRYQNLGGPIRDFLKESNVRLIEDRMVTSREYGTCCGGPLGPVDVNLSDRIAEDRASKLLSVSKNVLVACPLCYQNLSPYIKNIKDIAEVVS